MPNQSINQLRTVNLDFGLVCVRLSLVTIKVNCFTKGLASSQSGGGCDGVGGNDN